MAERGLGKNQLAQRRILVKRKGYIVKVREKTRGWLVCQLRKAANGNCYCSIKCRIWSESSKRSPYEKDSLARYLKVDERKG